MEPGLMPGDRLIAWRGFRSRAVHVAAGQVLVARHPQDAGMLIVKRAAWREADGWWVTADNPAAGGVDSLRLGPVPSALIEGRVLGRYWPVWRHR